MATLRPLHREEFGNELFLDGARPRSEHVAVRRSSNLRSRYQPLPAHLAHAGRAHVVLRSRVPRGRARGQVSAPTGLPTRPRYLSAWLVVHLQGGCRALPRGEGSPGTEVCARSGGHALLKEPWPSARAGQGLRNLHYFVLRDRAHVLAGRVVARLCAASSCGWLRPWQPSTSTSDGASRMLPQDRKLAGVVGPSLRLVVEVVPPKRATPPSFRPDENRAIFS